ncbi:MAG: ComEC/Rec2 family competence protein [Spirochaetia bacterium]|jgi:ComEC/Rec2-related protein|nr:ComEC/Rec2 family competence protein [Spirochaetia bacterium]
MKKNFCVPSLCFLLAMAAANLAANGTFFNDRLYIIGSAAGGASALVLFIFITRKISLAPGRFAAALLLMISLTGIEYVLTARHFNAAERAELSTTLRACVLSVTEQRYSSAALLELCGEKGKSPARVQAYADRALGLAAGDTVLFIKAKPSMIEPSSANVFAKQLLRRGIAYTVSLNQSNCTVESKTGPGLKEKIRKGAEEIFARSFSKETAALVNGLYFNDRHEIDKHTLQKFKMAGVTHVLAASGLHVGIIASLPLLLSAFFLLPGNLGRTAALLLISAYLFIAGAPVSLLRAVLMFAFFIFQRAMFNERNPFNILFWAGAVILLMSPGELYSLGFQLSFGATAAILVFFKNISAAFSFMPAFFKNSFAITASVNIVTAPIILLTLKEINYNGIIGNIAAVPGITLFMIASLVTVFISIFSAAAGEFLGAATDKIYELLGTSIAYISELPGHFAVSDNMVIPLLAFPCAMGVIALMRFKNRKKIHAALLCITMLSGGVMLFFGRDDAVSETIQLGESGKIIRDMNKASILGSIKGEYAEQAISILNTKMIRSCSIYIVNPDYENIRAYSRIVKQACVDECFIDKNFYLTGYMRGFFALLEQENVKISFADM